MEGKKKKEETIHICNKEGCGKEANLRCPNCKKLGIKSESYFCGKECFNSCWAEHKKIHEEYSPIEDGFLYTGPLRPYKITPRREVPKSIQCPDYAFHPEGISECEEAVKFKKEIPVYSEEDIEQMKIVCKLGRLVLDTAHKAVEVGVTTDELDQIVHETAIENDCYPSPLNYYKFPKSVCTSVNEVICHGIPDKRPLRNGDIVNLDVTVFHHGYHGDLNETYLVGTVDKKGKKLVKSTYNALMKAIEICKPGTKFSQIGDVISDCVEKDNYGVVRDITGHGICKLFHTEPTILHYRNNKTPGLMKPGNIFTIEPMINEGTWELVEWKDNWTVTTQDGKRSAQFEHTILITEDGCEVLTARNENSPELEIFKTNK
jgi:methionyl aminopeptidase